MQKLRTAKRHKKQDLSKSSIPPALPEFDKLFDIGLHTNSSEAQTLIFPNAKLTILEAIFNIIKDFVFTPDASKKSTSRDFSRMKEKFLPQCNLMPGSLEEALEIIDKYLMPLKTFHVCVNDCVVFRKDKSDLKFCPICQSPRYKADGKTAVKNFTYFPITPRLRRMVATRNIFTLLTMQHESGGESMADIRESPVWQSWFSDAGEFGNDTLGIVLNVSLDGVNPFKALKTEYSMWPIEIQILNLPPRLRKTAYGTLINGIIPSNGTKEPNTLEPYIEILVEELLFLQQTTMKNPDGFDVRVSAKALLNVLDFPAIGKVLHLPGSARSFRACPFCPIIGVNVCNKTVFLENRRFLPPDHKLRSETEGQVFGQPEHRPPPIMDRSAEETRALREEYDRLKNDNQRKAYTKTHGVKGVYQFMKLDYHKFEQHIGPDPMHTVKNTLVNIAKIMNGFVARDKISQSEREFRGTDADLYTLSVCLEKQEIKRVDERIGTLIFPADATGCKESFLTTPGKVQPTHAWHEYGTKNILIYLLRDCMDRRTRRSILFWLSVLNRMRAKVIQKEKVDAIAHDTAVSLALLERDTPVVFFNITTHMLVHEPAQLKEKGPAHSRSMFALERFNSIISRRVKSRKHPEASAIRTIRLMDWVMDVIIGQRLQTAKHEDPLSSVEAILATANGEEPVKTRKRKHSSELEEDEVSAISNKLKKNIEERKAVKLRSTMSKKFGEQGGLIRYQTKRAVSDYSKSSRYVFIHSAKVYGEITSILEHNEDNATHIWIVLRTFLRHEIDRETGLCFAVDQESNREKLLTTMDDLSEPLIVGVDGNHIWFISIEHDSKFEWITEHI